MTQSNGSRIFSESRILTKHVRGLAAFYRKRIWQSELRLSELLRVSERPRLVTRRVLNPFPLQVVEASVDGLRNEFGMFDVSLAITSEFPV